MVVDFKPDPRVPLILGRSFLKTSRALIDVYEGEITLRVGKDAITFNLNQTSRYTANYNHMTANRIDVIELASEEYLQEVLGFSDSVAYGIEVDRAKVEVIAKLPHPTTVKETPFFFSKECIESFNILKRKLNEAPILIAPDWDLPFELMCDAIDFAIGAVLGSVSRLQEGTNIYSWQSITYQNGLKQKRSPPMMPELFAIS
ncbi:reverse transcriptase domain-containing protein [Tanacetum coccineum]|uniref:Reverse transcriptase domain-containing protein n=1 Tax=Tanacetum coccineum TaxID=301880 RepID=A0ABQ5B0H5_9ASTR